jgi:tetratricopeptide (TPR) repeat protein
MFQGRSDEGLAMFQKALELDPYSPAIGSDYGQALFYARRYDESIAYLKKLIDQDPNYYRYHTYLADVYEKLGRYDDAVNERSTAALISGAPADEFRIIQERLLNSIRSGGGQGYWSTRLSIFTEFRQRRGVDPMTNYALWAELYSHLGQKDRAFEILNKGIDMKGDFPIEIKVSPQWDDLRDDPRFNELLRKLNFD